METVDQKSNSNRFYDHGGFETDTDAQKGVLRNYVEK